MQSAKRRLWSRKRKLGQAVQFKGLYTSLVSCVTRDMYVRLAWHTTKNPRVDTITEVGVSRQLRLYSFAFLMVDFWLDFVFWLIELGDTHTMINHDEPDIFARCGGAVINL